MPDPSADRGSSRYEWRGDERAAEPEGSIPDERRRYAEAEPGECPPAPAYRRCSAKREDERRHDQRDEVRGVWRQRSIGDGTDTLKSHARSPVAQWQRG